MKWLRRLHVYYLLWRINRAISANPVRVGKVRRVVKERDDVSS